MITKTQFEIYIRQVTGNSTYALTSSQLGLFSYYVDLYTEQLTELDILNLDDSISTIEYPIPYCQLQYLSTPLWQETGLVIEKYELGSNTPLVLNKNQQYSYNAFNIGITKYINAIDFKCLSCNCECEIIKITGKYGVKIPTYIMNLLMNIIYNNLNVSATSIGGSDCCSNIKSKSDGSGFSVTYYDKVTTAATASTKDKDNILSYPIILKWVNKLRFYFISI
jgi:hypothetical protein